MPFVELVFHGNFIPQQGTEQIEEKRSLGVHQVECEPGTSLFDIKFILRRVTGLADNIYHGPVAQSFAREWAISSVVSIMLQDSCITCSSASDMVSSVSGFQLQKMRRREVTIRV